MKLYTFIDARGSREIFRVRDGRPGRQDADFYFEGWDNGRSHDDAGAANQVLTFPTESEARAWLTEAEL